jgi:hypothetical protein
MSSEGHRLWLLYPTTPTFGYGFYRMANGARSAAAMDVISTFNSSRDAAYTGWPIRYPANKQTGAPANTEPITLMWRYFGPSPEGVSTSLRIKNGAPLAHTFITNLPAGHKGVSIKPTQALPNNTVIVVTITGTYNNAAFSYTWEFGTGSAVVQAAEGAAFDTGEGPTAP